MPNGRSRYVSLSGKAAVKTYKYIRKAYITGEHGKGSSALQEAA